jgi:hypothetical protein
MNNTCENIWRSFKNGYYECVNQISCSGYTEAIFKKSVNGLVWKVNALVVHPYDSHSCDGRLRPTVPPPLFYPISLPRNHHTLPALASIVTLLELTTAMLHHILMMMAWLLAAISIPDIWTWLLYGHSLLRWP